LGRRPSAGGIQDERVDAIAAIGAQDCVGSRVQGLNGCAWAMEFIGSCGGRAWRCHARVVRRTFFGRLMCRVNPQRLQLEQDTLEDGSASILNYGRGGGSGRFGCQCVCINRSIYKAIVRSRVYEVESKDQPHKCKINVLFNEQVTTRCM
jgi:hypothetical protein